MSKSPSSGMSELDKSASLEKDAAGSTNGVVTGDRRERLAHPGEELPEEGDGKKKPWWNGIREPGHALQIIVAAAIALALGIGISSATEVPDAAVTLLLIPGTLWLRALTCVVLPLIIVSMILAVQRLREISSGGPRLAKWTILYYVSTTVIAIAHSTLLTGLVWRPLFTELDGEALVVSAADQDMVSSRQEVAIEDVVVDMFNSFIPRNIVDALATNALLAVLIASIVVGYLIKDKDSTLLKLAREVEAIISTIIAFLIKLAPIGVFFLIFSNIMRLKIAEVGENLGILIGGTLCNMAVHTLLIMPTIFFFITRKNPYSYMIKNGSALLTAWGTASSAATLPITLREARKRGNPAIVVKFLVPLGTLINMDGTAIYFPIVVNLLAATQGITLNAANYVILILLSTLASIGTTPIPSSSLVLVVMICTSIDVPITGVYGLVTAIDWFLDRFRTMLNVNGDLMGAAIVSAITKIQDPPGAEDLNAEEVEEAGRQEMRRQRSIENV